MTATDELRRLLDERGVEYSECADVFARETYWQDETRKPYRASESVGNGGELTVRHLTPEQAITATLGNANRVYVLRGTDPNAMPSCGSETNELLGIYATHEAAEKAKAEWHGYCELNITEWEVVKR